MIDTKGIFYLLFTIFFDRKFAAAAAFVTRANKSAIRAIMSS